MTVIDPPFQGSGLRKVDVSGPNSAVGSWRELVKHVDVVGVCARLGQAIEADPCLSPKLCTKCSTVPSERFFLVAPMQCLEALANAAGSSVNDLKAGECKLGFKTFWSADDKLWARCPTVGQAPCWNAVSPYQVLQQLSTRKPKTTKQLVLQDRVSRDGVVVFGEDFGTLRPFFAAVSRVRDSYSSS